MIFLLFRVFDNSNDNNNFSSFSSLSYLIHQPIVVGASGMIKKKTGDYIKRIPGISCLQESQKIVLNGTAHLLRRVLSM